MPEELQKMFQVSFNAARIGYHQGPAWFTRIFNPCENTEEAYQRIREEFPDDTWEVWDVVSIDHLVPRMGRPSEGRTFRVQAAITPVQAAWLEEQKIQHGDKSLSDVIFKLINKARQE